MKSQPSSWQLAHKALLEHQKTEAFLKNMTFLSGNGLALELAYGVMRERLLLSAIAKNVLYPKKIKIARSLEFLLWMAIYALRELKSIPVYAICDEIMKIAKKKEASQSKFLNFLLRNHASDFAEYDVKNLPFYEQCSIPKELFELLRLAHSENVLTKVLPIFNKPAPVTYWMTDKESQSHRVAYQGAYQDVYLVKPKQVLPKTSYRQSVSYVALFDYLKPSCQRPARILDMCSAPGGKLLLLRKLFPSASLFAVEKSAKRLAILKQNNDTYSIQAEIIHKDALSLSCAQKYDLIVIDAPCSNTGVLHKCPEAKWSFSKKALLEHTKLQYQLISHAKSLLSDQGVLWYGTCSLLSSENEQIVNRACHELSLRRCLPDVTVLPDASGMTGAFFSSLKT